MSIPKAKLPQQLERHLSALSSLYAQERKRELQELVVNAQIRVHEDWDNDFNIRGHAVYFSVPESLFLNIARRKQKVQDEIRSDLNELCNVNDECIAAVFFENQLTPD